MRNHDELTALNALPLTLQQEILEILEGDENNAGRSVSECAAWLAERGILAGAEAVEHWQRRQLHRIRMEWCESMTLVAIEDARRPNHVYSDDELLSIGIRLFNALVVKTCRNETLSRNQTAEIRRQTMLRLERELDKELEKFAAANSPTSHTSPPSHP